MRYDLSYVALDDLRYSIGDDELPEIILELPRG